VTTTSTTRVGRRRAGAVAATLVVAAALAGCGSTTSSSSTTTSSSTTSSTSTTTTTQPTTPQTLGPLLPLFPFASAADVTTWQSQYGATGADSWHLQPGLTAVKFAAWLGFGQISDALLVRGTANNVAVTVGFTVADAGSTTVRSAIVHLVRWGTGSHAPWEVVGTNDTTLTVSLPVYGVTASSPVTVGGRITGVDENIKVRARALSSTGDVGVSCCSAAGGTRSPWSRSLTFTAASGTVVTIVAQTGGHVAQVERFAVTGIRVS
jgi:hypothetical protein